MDSSRIVEIGTLIVALIAVYLAWKKTPKENQARDADAASNYAKAAGQAIDQNEKLILRVGLLEQEREKVICEIEKLKLVQADMSRLIMEWMIGIERLIRQITESGLKPVWHPTIPAALRRIVAEMWKKLEKQKL